MVITTNQLNVCCLITTEWVDISVYPKFNRDAKPLDPVTIEYTPETLVTDLDLDSIISTINDEPRLMSEYLSGHDLKDIDYNTIYTIPSLMSMKTHPVNKIDRFFITQRELMYEGASEMSFIMDDISLGKKEMSIQTAIKLEAMKYIRLALKYFS